MSIAKKRNCVNGYVAQCNHYTKYSKQGVCSSHAIRYDYLEEDVLALLKEVGKRVYETMNTDEIINKAKITKVHKKSESEKRIRDIDAEIRRCKSMIDILYQDRLNEVITVDKYVELSNIQNSKIKQLTVEKDKLKARINPKTDDKSSKNKLEEINKLVKECMYFENPNSEVLNRIIYKIEVDKQKNIEIFFKVDLSYYMDSYKKKGEK